MLDDSSTAVNAAEDPWRSRVRNDLFEGTPGLAVEVCDTNTEVDVRPKLALCQRAGWKEYVTPWRRSLGESSGAFWSRLPIA
jgi:hypothetical protein